MARNYRLVVTSDSTHSREYPVIGVDVLAHAQRYGRGEGGETVTLYTMHGKPIARAVWDSSAGYIKVAPPEDALPTRSAAAAMREKRGLTVAEVAAKSGLSMATIWRTESGRNPSTPTIYALATVYECSIEDLIDDA